MLLRSVGALVGRFLYRVGRFGAEHRLLVAFIWLAAVAATVGAVVLGAKTNNELTLPGTDSQAAFDILAEPFLHSRTARARSCSRSTTAS